MDERLQAAVQKLWADVARSRQSVIDIIEATEPDPVKRAAMIEQLDREAAEMLKASRR